MDLIHEIDKLLDTAGAQEREGETYGSALERARELAVAYIKHRQAADEEAARTINDLRADLDHAERDNRRLAAENKRLKGEANTSRTRFRQTRLPFA